MATPSRRGTASWAGITELFEGPAASIFMSVELYMRVHNPGQPDLFIPYTEIVDISEVK